MAADPADDKDWRRGGFQIGGPYGVVIGGGHGLRIGGPRGVQFGGGRGAKFGGPAGVQFGGGRGAKFGGPDGVQFGGGAGAKFGSLQFGGGTTDGTADGARPAPQATPVGQPPITVHYPADAKKNLTFTLNGEKYEITPDQTMTLRPDRRWILSFDRRPGGRRVHYTLSGGSYDFRQTGRGWKLRRAAATPRLAPVPTPASPRATKPEPEPAKPPRPSS